MAAFVINFLICNIFIGIIVGILLAVKGLFKNIFSSRMQYNLWFLLLILLAVPFLPIGPIGPLQPFLWLYRIKSMSALHAKVSIADTAAPGSFDPASWMNDFSLSVTRNPYSAGGLILCGIWVLGIAAMIAVVIKSKIRLDRLKKSALPLQNPAVCSLYHNCLAEMNITKDLPVYSAALLKSPIITGLFKPCIYLPIHLISDYTASDMRYILLHELQHYRHKDNFANYLMNLAGIVYWFNPFVWYALREMRNDREIACDSSVLNIIGEESYEDYGNTLINFAAKLSLTPFPFSAGISGSMGQMRKRILNIASYEKPSAWKRIEGIIAFTITSALLLNLAPSLSTYGADQNRYHWNPSRENITYMDLASYFGGYEGSFVMYDLEQRAWSIYNKNYATLRVSPDSTYKIYDALIGLESGVISPEQSEILWDGTNYYFDAWNTDQNLFTAMRNSVTWYFQALDHKVGFQAVKDFIQEINYGNQNMTGSFSSYWMESSLKISPIEQVELLKKFHCDEFSVSSENIRTVKDSICLYSSPEASFYGKTGSGRVNDQDVNGWFIGYIETSGHTYYFSSNIQGESGATGTAASEIALSILSDLQIWNGFLLNDPPAALMENRYD